MGKKLTPKERVLTALSCNEPDQVPIDYEANAGIDRRLKEHFGLDERDDEGLRQALGVDFRAVHVKYIGPKLHEDLPGGIKVDMWGVRRRWIEHATGGYWDYCDWPLTRATLEEVEAWPMPSPDDFAYDTVEEMCKRYEPYAIRVGDAGIGCVINTAGFLRSMDQVLVDLITDDPAGLRLIDRFLAIQLEVMRRTIEAGKGRFDFMMIGEDLGTQIGPLISMELYRKHIRPRHQPFVDLAKAYDLPVMVHTCGSSSWAYEDFIEMGVDAVDTLQPEATDMSPRYLKEHFGGRLAFHGCISTAGPVATGTVQDVVENCRETLEIMMPGGGYCFSPTHALQDNSPTENVLAMYETAKQYGKY